MACDHFPTLSLALAASPISLTALAPQDPSAPEAHVECHVKDEVVSVSLTGGIRAAAGTGRRKS
jgi:hypothetical protein